VSFPLLTIDQFCVSLYKKKSCFDFFYSERSAAPEGIPLGPASALPIVDAMSYFVYILYSFSKDKFYIGQTSDVNDRLQRHNNRRVKSTKFGIPWKLAHTEKFETRQQAINREQFLKSPQGWRILLEIKNIFFGT
jgi:putative endonuclease